MKGSKFSESQIAFVLRQGDEGVREICWKAGIGQATYLIGDVRGTDHARRRQILSGGHAEYLAPLHTAMAIVRKPAVRFSSLSRAITTSI